MAIFAGSNGQAIAHAQVAALLDAFDRADGGDDSGEHSGPFALGGVVDFERVAAKLAAVGEAPALRARRRVRDRGTRRCLRRTRPARGRAAAGRPGRRRGTPRPPRRRLRRAGTARRRGRGSRRGRPAPAQPGGASPRVSTSRRGLRSSSPGRRTSSRGRVGAQRAAADEDRVAAGALAVDVGARRLAGDPLAGAVGAGDEAVGGHRELERDVRPAERAPREIAREARAAGSSSAQVGRDPGRAQPRDARARRCAGRDPRRRSPRARSPPRRRRSAQAGPRSDRWAQGSSVT